jgi:hypothetical protein
LIADFARFTSDLQLLPPSKFMELYFFQYHCDKNFGAQFSPPLSGRFNQYSIYLKVEEARRTHDCYVWMLENPKLSEYSQKSSKIVLPPPHKLRYPGYKDDE